MYIRLSLGDCQRPFLTDQHLPQGEVVVLPLRMSELLHRYIREQAQSRLHHQGHLHNHNRSAKMGPLMVKRIKIMKLAAGHIKKICFYVIKFEFLI